MQSREKSFTIKELFAHAFGGAVWTFIGLLALFVIVDLFYGNFNFEGLFDRGRRDLIIILSYIGLNAGAFLYARKVRQLKFYLLVFFSIWLLSCILGFLHTILFTNYLFSVVTVVSLILSSLAVSLLGVVTSLLHGFDRILINAVKQGDVALVKKLLAEKSIAIETLDYFGDTLLHVAALYDHKEFVELLLSNGANVNAQNNAKKTALHLAALYGRKDFVELLLAKGANGNIRDKYSHDPLHYAKQGQHKEVEKLLALQSDK